MPVRSRRKVVAKLGGCTLRHQKDVVRSYEVKRPVTRTESRLAPLRGSTSVFQVTSEHSMGTRLKGVSSDDSIKSKKGASSVSNLLGRGKRGRRNDAKSADRLGRRSTAVASKRKVKLQEWEEESSAHITSSVSATDCAHDKDTFFPMLPSLFSAPVDSRSCSQESSVLNSRTTNCAINVVPNSAPVDCCCPTLLLPNYLTMSSSVAAPDKVMGSTLKDSYKGNNCTFVPLVAQTMICPLPSPPISAQDIPRKASSTIDDNAASGNQPTDEGSYSAAFANSFACTSTSAFNVVDIISEACRLNSPPPLMTCTVSEVGHNLLHAALVPLLVLFT